MEQQSEKIQIIQRFVDYFNRNKQTVFFVGGAIVLLLIIFSLVLISGKKSVNTTPIPKVSVETTGSPSQKPVSPTPAATVTISPQKREAIISQTKQQLDTLITIDYTIPTIKQYGDKWAIMVVANPSTDPANVVVENINGSWKVQLGPGTHFDEQSLQAIGAPQTLIDDANKSL